MRLLMLQDLKENQLRDLHMRLTVGVDTEGATTVVSPKVVRKLKERKEISKVLHPVAGDAEASEVEEDQEGSTVDASSEVDVVVEVAEAARITAMMMAHIMMVHIMMAAMKEKWKLKAP